MSFPLYFDEHIPSQLATSLQALGHDVLTARDAGMANRGISDDSQLSFAAASGRVLLTYDIKDFSRLALE